MRRLVHGSALTIAALTFAASADAATTDANSSRGTADLSWSTRKPIIGPASDKLGGDLAVQFSADLDPPKDPTKPLLSVAMKGVVLEASWHDDKTIQLAPADSKSLDGTFKVEHTLAPHVKVFAKLFGNTYTFDYNAESLIGDLPGSSWNYVGTGSATFTPWAMKNFGIVKVQGPALADAQLLSKPLEDIIGNGGSNTIVNGVLAFNATTTPTFNYATTEVTVDGGSITKGKSSWSMQTTDADFLDITTVVKGEISYSGNLYGRPSITITKLAGFSIPPGLLTFEIGAAGVELPYESGATPIAVEFPAQKIHIPLPNVKATNSLDVGNATIGNNVTKQSEIKNTGELEAVLSIKSSNPQFSVVSDKVMKAKEKFSLDIKFTPTEEGPQSAEITVTSNDPNEPVQVIKVSGTGTKVVVPPEPEPEPARGEDSGCGCRTAPAPTGYAAFGAVGIALAAILRRRRR